MMGTSQIKSIGNQKGFFILLVVLLSVTLIFKSHLYVRYAEDNSIFSGNQISPNATYNNMGAINSTLQITTDKQRYVQGETVIVT
jgi:hypothetical protein